MVLISASLFWIGWQNRLRYEDKTTNKAYSGNGEICLKNWRVGDNKRLVGIMVKYLAVWEDRK